MNVLVSFFDKSVPTPSNWFGWSVIRTDQDTAIGYLF